MIRKRTFGSLAAIAIGMAACVAPSPREITVVGRDYAFDAPDTIAAGGVTFQYRNAGAVRHEMIVAALKPGVTTAAFSAAMARDSGFTPLAEQGVGVIFAEPGMSNHLGIVLDLVRGHRYALMCRFQDGPTKPHHDQLGMYKLIVVK